MNYLSLIGIILVFFVNQLTFAQASSLSYKEFGHLPMVKKARVSPDGKSIAAIFNNEEGPSVVVSDFGSLELTTILKLKKSQDRIDWIYWANSERLIVSSSYSTSGYGNRYRISRLFAINKDGNELKEIKRNLKKDAPNWLKKMSPRLISTLPNDQQNILISLYNREDNASSVFKVNIYENDFDKVFANKYNVHAWGVNGEGDVVFGFGMDEDDTSYETSTIWFREGVDAEWKLLHKKKYFSGESFNPILVKGDKLYVISDHNTGRQALWLYDIKTATFEKIVYAHKKYDIRGAILNHERNEVIGVSYFDDYQKNHFFEKSESNVYQIVKNSFKDYQTSIASWSQSRKKVLVRAQSHNTPSKYFWLDLEKRAGGFWFSQYPYLEGKTLGNKTAFEFEARDGMKLNGYLTMPSNFEGEKPKLIVHPHGGPFGPRDYRYFDSYVHYMASLGYAVLQVNYRGSGGFGTFYETEGYREWGKKMQDDVYDAVDWLKSEKSVDTDNACVVGGSYGGYVALTASFQKPKDFKCIVSIAGVADLHEFAKYRSKSKGGLSAHIRETVGDPSVEAIARELKNNSAEYHLEKIKAPILLIHGVYDTRVRVVQSQEFYRKAKSAGIDITYKEFEYGTHFLDENDNRLAAFEVLGEFLTKHL